jgi:hypothetical protein
LGIELMLKGRTMRVEEGGLVTVMTTMIPGPAAWPQTVPHPHSDNRDFPNWINEPKMAYLSERALKLLGDRHPSLPAIS